MLEEELRELICRTMAESGLGQAADRREALADLFESVGAAFARAGYPVRGWDLLAYRLVRHRGGPDDPET